MLDYSTTTYNSPIIVALDYNNESDVMQFIAKLEPNLCKLKVGKELFTSCGPKLIEKLIVSGFDVFLDLKFHDIPNTVYKACKVATDLGVWMLNVHISGGQKMLEMARMAINESTHKPLLIGVTVLTSMNQHDLQQVGINIDLQTHVKNLAKLAYTCGLDGVVCSAHEAQFIKNVTHQNFLTICPGIRLDNSPTDDQQRIMTVTQALNNHADFLVIGRPITQSINPYKTLLDTILK